MNASRTGPPASLYVAGPFSMGYVDFFTFLMPIYGLSLGLDASEIGILVGARSTSSRCSCQFTSALSGTSAARGRLICSAPHGVRY